MRRILLSLTFAVALPSAASADPLAELAAQRAMMMNADPSSAIAGANGMPPAGMQMPAATPSVTDTPTELMQDSSANAAMSVPQMVPPVEEPVDPTQYRTGRGDGIELNFWGKQNLKFKVTVDAEGRVFIPKIGYMMVAGHTLAETRTAMQAQVKRYYPGLQFDLSLAQARTFLVHVVENVARPGVYPSNPLERVSALAKRVGIQGSRRRIEIHHRDGRVVVADLVRYEATGDRSLNPFLEDGDVIRVPAEGPVATISGPVWRPGRYELTGSRDMGELLALAGGLRTEVTHTLPVRVHRRTADDHIAEISFPWKRDGEPPMFALKPDDEVVVPSLSELQQTVLLVGALAGAKPVTPLETDAVLRMPFIEGDSVRMLIERGGGLSADADMGLAYVKRGEQHLPLDLDALLVRRDFSADRKIEMGDIVVIPRKRRSIMVEGSVFRPGVYDFRPNRTVEDYVGIAGGAQRDARPASSYDLITAKGKTVKNALKLVPSPGDTIVVPERSFSRADTVHLLLSAGAVVVSAVSVTVIAVEYKK